MEILDEKYFSLLPNIKKESGSSFGNLYSDPEGYKWLIKKPPMNILEYVIREYVAGAIYKYFLKKNVPETKIVLLNNELMIASKYLSDFFDLEFLISESIPIPTIFNQTKVEVIYKTLSVMWLLNDVDGHRGNIGFILKPSDNVYHFSKIDHGLSFGYQAYLSQNPATIEELTQSILLKGYYEFSFSSTNTLIFFKKSITEITNTPAKKILNVIRENFNPIIDFCNSHHDICKLNFYTDLSYLQKAIENELIIRKKSLKNEFSTFIATAKIFYNNLTDFQKKLNNPIFFPTNSKKHFFSLALQEGKILQLNILLKHGIDPNSASGHINISLLLVYYLDNLEAFQTLLKYGANGEIIDIESGKNLLQLALSEQKLDFANTSKYFQTHHCISIPASFYADELISEIACFPNESINANIALEDISYETKENIFFSASNILIT